MSKHSGSYEKKYLSLIICAVLKEKHHIGAINTSMI